MRRYFGLLAWIAVAMPSAGAAELSITAEDVGEIYQYTHAKSVISLNNLGDAPVKIISLAAARPGDKVPEVPALIPPRSSVYVPVEIFSALDAGDGWHSFRLEIDDPKRSVYSARVHVFALSVLDDPLPEVDLGVIDANHEASASEVALSSREIPNLQITRVIDSPDFADAKIASDHRTIEIAAKARAAWGRHIGLVKVALNSTVQPEAWINVIADIHGDVIPSQNPFDLGLTRRGSDLPALVQLQSRDGKPFKTGAITVEGIKAGVSVTACAAANPGCAQLEFRIADDQPTGRIVGNINIDLPDHHRTLTVNVMGLLLDKDAKVISLDEQVKKASAAADGSTGATVNQAKKIDLAKALSQSVEPKERIAAAVALPGKGPLIRWQVANEQSIYGYSIYRSETETGQFLRVNSDIVRATGDGSPGLTSAYQWRDNSAESGKTYWYYVGMINKNGTKQQLSGPQKVVAK